MRVFNVALLGSPDLVMGELYSVVVSVNLDDIYNVVSYLENLDSAYMSCAIDQAMIAYNRQCDAQGVEPLKITSVVMSEVI